VIRSLARSRSAAFVVGDLRADEWSIRSEQWADRATVHEIAAEFRAWGESPDAYLASFKCAATGRRPD
jgi:hypothetical protein